MIDWRCFGPALRHDAPAEAYRRCHQRRISGLRRPVWCPPAVNTLSAALNAVLCTGPLSTSGGMAGSPVTSSVSPQDLIGDLSAGIPATQFVYIPGTTASALLRFLRIERIPQACWKLNA